MLQWQRPSLAARCISLSLVSAVLTLASSACPYVELSRQAVQDRDSDHWTLPVTCGVSHAQETSGFTLILLDPTGRRLRARSTFPNGTSTFPLGERARDGLYRCLVLPVRRRQPAPACPRPAGRVYVHRIDVLWALSEARHQVQVAATQRANDDLERRVRDAAAENEALRKRIGPLSDQNQAWKDRIRELEKQIRALTGIINAVNCGDLKRNNRSATSGLYAVRPGRDPLTVYCDHDTGAGGWTVIQRRIDGREDFYRKWDSYARGFGNLTHEFWLGLDNIHLLTSSANLTLRVELKNWRGQSAWSEWEQFGVAGADDMYRLSVGGFNTSSTAGDGFNPPHNTLVVLNGTRFSTRDRDNDNADRHCARVFYSAWWYRACSSIDPNSRYRQGVHTRDGIRWWPWQHDLRSLKAIEMKVRPKM